MAFRDSLWGSASETMSNAPSSHPPQPKREALPLFFLGPKDAPHRIPMHHTDQQKINSILERIQSIEDLPSGPQQLDEIIGLFTFIEEECMEYLSQNPTLHAHLQDLAEAILRRIPTSHLSGDLTHRLVEISVRMLRMAQL